MTTYNYGLTDWDKVEIKGRGQANNKDLFLRLKKNGSNIVRVLTKPHEYLVHFYKENKDDQGFGTRIKSSIVHGSDPIVDKTGQQPSSRYFIGVIDRSTQSYKLLDCPKAIIRSIKKLAEDEDWGDPTHYDIDIKVDPNAGAAGYYNIVPKPKKPLSAADLDIKNQIDLEDLKRRCSPLTPEQVKEAMDKVHQKNRTNGTQPATTQAVAEVAVVEDEFDFPAADGSDS